MTTPTSPTGERRGFTLVETLVVVTIIAVLAGMIIPTMLGSWGQRRLDESARRVMLAARRARVEAVLCGRPVRLVLEEQPARFRLEALTEADPAQRTPAGFAPLPGQAGRWQTLEGQVSFGQIGIEPIGEPQTQGQPPQAVTFTPRGEADLALIQITDGTRSWTVQIAPYTGAVQLLKGRVETRPENRLDLDAQ